MTYKHRDIVIAYMDGKQIQVKDSEDKWRNLSSFDGYCIWPQFKADFEYRIKPETRKYRVVMFNDGTTYTADDKEQHDNFQNHVDFVRWLTDWVEYEV